MKRTDVERTDRAMGAGAQGDRTSGNEGIDDPAMTRTRREALNRESGSREQGRESTDEAESFSGQGAQKEGNMDNEGVGYTGNRRPSNTDESSSENPLT